MSNTDELVLAASEVVEIIEKGGDPWNTPELDRLKRALDGDK